MDLQHGVHYLIDYYRVLGVSLDADDETIKKAYRALQLQYHPDRFRGLAEEFRAEAEFKIRVINEAHAVLEDPEKRKEFDLKLQTWEGPISHSGHPIFDPTKPHFSPLFLIFGTEEDEKFKNLYQELSLKFSGFDQNTLALIENLYQTDPTPEVRGALRVQLGKKDLALTLKEGKIWMQAGFLNEKPPTSIPLAYESVVESRIEGVRKLVGEKIYQTLMSVLVKAGDVDLKMLGAGEEVVYEHIAKDPATALEQLRGRALRRLDGTAASLKVVAKERALIAKQLLETLEIEYRPEQQTFYPYLGLCIVIPAKHQGKFGHEQWFHAWIENENKIAVKTLDNIDLSSAEIAAEWIKSNKNIIRFTPLEGVDLQDQIFYVVRKHFERVVEDREKIVD